MAIFGWKKSGDQKPASGPAAGAGASGNGAAASEPESSGDTPSYQPEKAKRFFEHAKTVHNTTNYEYAMQLWLSGLRLDPGNITALEGFFGSASSFLGDEAGKKGLSKETYKVVGSGKGDVEKLLVAMLEWGSKPGESTAAVKAVESAGKLGLPETTYWLGERALRLTMNDKKPRKDLFIKLMEAFKSVGAFELAVLAGEGARKLDLSDGPLAAEIRNMAAQATMTKGGYDQTGQAGGFRANVRDLDKQRRLEDQDKIVKTEETVDRLLVAAEADYLKRSQDPSAINVYVKRLRERGRPEDEAGALEVLSKAYEETQQIRYRIDAGEIKLRQARRRASALRNAAEAAPGDAAAHTAAHEAALAFVKQEVEELQLKSSAYPTDLGIKFELGRRHFQLGEFETAIPLFQEATGDGKSRNAALNFLGQSFLKVNYPDEAVATFRQAIDAKDILPELQMELRYWLMCALQVKAETSKDVGAAEEADKLASAISIQQFNYRDVRQRREAIKKLVTTLKGG